MGKKILHAIVLAILFIVLLSCLGTETKKLSVYQPSNNPNDVSDSLVVKFAFRDTSAETAGTPSTYNYNVALQGLPGSDKAAFTNFCNTTGDRCKCEFYTNATSTTPVYSTSVSISQANNIITCIMPTTITPSDYTRVRLRVKDQDYATGLVVIQSAISLVDLMSGLDTANIRRIYNYSCERGFLQGHGISGSIINCSDTSMMLGKLSAFYTFYQWQSFDGTQNDATERSTSLLYNDPGTICGLTFPQYNCTTSANVLRYGLYSKPVAPFTAPVTLTSGLAPKGTTAIVGYAAPTDDDLNCPPGLVKIRVYRAQPKSVAQSNFVNSTDNFSDIVTEPVSEAPSTFTLQQTAGTALCNASGICAVPSGAITTLQTVSYLQESPVVCAIPKTLL